MMMALPALNVSEKIMLKNKCTLCLKLKPLNDFYKSKTKGYYIKCKKCYSDLNRNWYIKNKEWKKKKSKEWHKNNEKKHKEIKKIWYKNNKESHYKSKKEWVLNNPEKVLKINLKKYGITIDQFKLLLNKQKEKCAICKTHTSKLNIRISVDHCHKTGQIRGLLCNRCNFGIGYFKENINSLKEAIKYLKKHHKGEILW